MGMALVRAGRTVVALKPVETGHAGPPAPDEDGVLLANATGQHAPDRALVRLRQPVAPPVAADNEGRSLTFDEILDATRGAAVNAELILVEGAGGLLTPLTWRTTAVDLAKALQAEVLLVSADRLGCIHHVRAALAVLEKEQLPILGILLTAPAEADHSTGSNLAALQRVTQTPRIHAVPRTTDADAMVKAIQPVLSWLAPVQGKP